jgi:hypothetical protein
VRLERDGYSASAGPEPERTVLEDVDDRSLEADEIVRAVEG